MEKRIYPSDFDYIWIAGDRRGHLGAFATGGAGPIPMPVLDSIEFALDDIEGRVATMPVVSSAQLLVPMKRPDSFVDLAERGFFVFDWTDVHRTLRESIDAYELVAVPADPVRIDQQPEEIRCLLAGVVLETAFGGRSTLDVRTYVTCCEPERR